MSSVLDLAAAAAAGAAAGALNAIAGGGTLVSFPTLLAIGLPAVTANVTSTVALFPGFIGGTLAQREDLRGQGMRLRRCLPAGVAGGLAGAILLLAGGESTFRAIVPFLILFASGLLAAQERLRAALAGRGLHGGDSPAGERWLALPVGIAAIYGGYFGAGMSVVVLAVLGLAVDDTLTRLNGLKQAIGLATNLTAAALFLFSGEVAWALAGAMAVGALAGGAAGGRLASRIPAGTLRAVVVAAGLGLGIYYLVR